MTRTGALWLVCVCLLSLGGVARADLFIIVNPENSVSSLTADQIGRLFLQKAKRFDNDIAALPLSQPERSVARERFNDIVLQRNEQQLKYYWSRKMFNGGDRPPRIVRNDAAMIEAVASETGAIGYVLAAPSTDKVKIVLKLP